VAVTTTPKVQLRPILPADVQAVARFLHANLNARVEVEAWARAVDVPWDVDRPNAGFMLLDGDTVVGAHLALYADRTIAGATERFCNLGAWCVLEGYRFHALRLLKALLAQDGYHFTDFSPSGNVVGLNARLGFKHLDNTTTVVPNLPWPSLPLRDTITADPERIERALEGDELVRYRDHAKAVAARHLLLERGGERCYVIWRRDRRKGVPVFASILYVSNPAVFRRMAGPLARHLLLRHGAPMMLIERAVVEHHPKLSRVVTDSPRYKMFRSASLAPEQIDYLYSELVCLSW
jgi:hypothetical protein